MKLIRCYTGYFVFPSTTITDRNQRIVSSFSCLILLFIGVHGYIVSYIYILNSPYKRKAYMGVVAGIVVV
jgi:hypothetical protein